MSSDSFAKTLLIALGTSEQTAQIVLNYIDELRAEAGRLRTELVCVKQDLKDATMGQCNCSNCGKKVWNAWRDSDGHHCLTCLAGQRDTRYGYSEIEAACGEEVAIAVAKRRLEVDAC